MARSVFTDYLQLFRFHVTASPTVSEGMSFFGPPTVPQAAFARVSVPEVTVADVTFREGLAVFTKRFPGFPEMSNIVLGKGATVADTMFYDWIKAMLEGRDYAVDLTIRHFHRADSPLESSVEYILKNAFPIRFRPSEDLDATAPDIAVEELEVVYESFDVKKLGKTVTVAAGKHEDITQQAAARMFAGNPEIRRRRVQQVIETFMLGF